jgi:hypothetical protein
MDKDKQEQIKYKSGDIIIDLLMELQRPSRKGHKVQIKKHLNSLLAMRQWLAEYGEGE